MPDLQGSFIWYELITPDPVGAKSFYDNVVGWDIEPEASMAGRDYRMIRRSDGGNAGGLMGLSEEMAANGARPMWLGYLGSDDVDSTLSAIEADGGKVLLPAWDIPDVARMAMAADPQGAPFYVMTPRLPARQGAMEADVFSVDQPQHVRWNELSTTDSDSAVAFYTRHFGWRQEGEMDMGEYGKYRFLYQGETMIGAIMPEMPVSLWTYYIGVDDIDRAAEAIRSGGGQILQGPMEIPGGDYALNGVDPQGAAFALVGPRKP